MVWGYYGLVDLDDWFYFEVMYEFFVESFKMFCNNFFCWIFGCFCGRLFCGYDLEMKI